MQIVDVQLKDKTGNILFERKGVEAPRSWSKQAIDIAAAKFFTKDECSIFAMVKRVSHTLVQKAQWLLDFDPDFENKLYDILISQRASFNSPVWFNLGVFDNPMLCACYILKLEDSMDSILDINTQSGNIFKYGGGTGVNYSRIRAKDEALTCGGKASGPMSFMKGHDAFAGIIKSGGKTRRAARMAILDIDHPDIEEFIECKSIEEEKIRLLNTNPKWNNPDNPLESESVQTVAYQNGNNSVRVSDAFMKAVEADDDWSLIGRVSGKPVKTVKARELFRKIAENAWKTGDPGLQFDDTINKYNPLIHKERINASNPCSEFMFIDESACNLSSLTLWRYWDGKEFDYNLFAQDIHIMIAAMDAICTLARYPSERIHDNSVTYRPLGLGYAGLGSLFMRRGLAYGSDHAANLTEKITKFMTTEAWKASERLYEQLGTNMSTEDQKSIRNMVREHYGLEIEGARNAQVTLLAPTGCVTGDTLILSNEGVVPIESLVQKTDAWQDISLTVGQESQSTKATQLYLNGESETITVTSIMGHSLSGTPEHRIRVIDELGNYVWKRLDELNSNHYIVRRLGGHEQFLQDKEYTSITISELGDIDINEDFAEIIGCYMGNGYLKTRGGLHIAINAKDPDLVEHIQDQCRKTFRHRTTLEQRPGCVIVNLFNQNIKPAFTTNGISKDSGNHGEGSANAEIPLVILRSRTSVLCAFLRGLFETDGCVHQNKYGQQSCIVALTSVSKKLVSQIQFALETLGIKSSLRVMPVDSRHLGKRPLYELRLKSQLDVYRFEEKIGFISQRKRSKLATAKDFKHKRGCDITIDHDVLVQDFYKSSKGLPADVRGGLSSRARSGSLNLQYVKDIIAEYPDIMKKSKLSQILEMGNLYLLPIKSIKRDGVQFTYDLSVPQDNTYIANGFVVHNTIGLQMDSDTQGIEPFVTLIAHKQLVGGGMLVQFAEAANVCLEKLGYNVAEALDYAKKNKTLRGFVRDMDLPIFATAIGDNVLAPEDHLRIMAAAQQHISGAISKTVNLPQSATVDDIENIYIDAWKRGLKAIALYRDNSKAFQPISDGKEQPAVGGIRKKRLPPTRKSITHKIELLNGIEAYLTVSQYDDGTPGELFLNLSTGGSTLAGMADMWAIAISMGLQYGIPVDKFVEKFMGRTFEPGGYTTNPEIQTCTSLVDYIAQFLSKQYSMETIAKIEYSGTRCSNCGSDKMMRNGTCHVCQNCGTTTGCG